MNNLDHSELYSRLDPDGMGQYVAGFADQCRAAWKNVASFQPPEAFKDAEQGLILGMGGSAIGGDLLRTLVAGECGVPITVWREYQVPRWVNARTLVIASSNSGNTEETLSAYGEALTRGAMLLVITTGGKLAAFAREAGAAVITFDFKSQPRAALGYSFISLLGVIARIGWIADPSKNLERALAAVDELESQVNVRVPTGRNRAKQLAQSVFDKLPMVYGSGVLGEVAHRWKTQFNENSKTTAGYDLMSELNHNSVVGFQFPKSVLANTLFILLRSNDEPARIARRFDVTRELLEQRGLVLETIRAEGDSALAEMLWTIHLGDYITYYLALLNGVDPTPVEAIDFLKGQLADASAG